MAGWAIQIIIKLIGARFPIIGALSALSRYFFNDLRDDTVFGNISINISLLLCRMSAIIVGGRRFRIVENFIHGIVSIFEILLSSRG